MSHRYAAALAGLFAAGGLALGQAPGGPAPGPAPAAPAAPAAPVAQGGPAAPAPAYTWAYPYGPMIPPPNPAVPSSLNPTPYPPAALGGAANVDEGCPPWRAWVSAEYLVYFLKSAPLPPNLISIASPLEALTSAIGLGSGSTPVTGQNSLGFGPFSGGRLTGGFWLDPDQLIGIEANAFLTQTQMNTFLRRSDLLGLPELGFNHFDGGGVRDVFPASSFGGLHPATRGSVGYAASSQLWGSEGNFVSRIYGDSNTRVQLLTGFRYLDLSEKLDLDSESAALPTSTSHVSFLGLSQAFPAAVTSVDSFHTRNQFYGGQIGASADCRWGSFIFSLGGRVAIGDNHESVDIAGVSSLLLGKKTLASVDAGQFAVPSNIGRTTHEQFGVIPEVQLKAAYQICHNVSGFVGYDFLYWNQVVRPGSQIDPTVDPRNVPTSPSFGGLPLPKIAETQALFNRTDFWAQGVTFGLELTY